jgi:hypothetical protein
MLEKKFFNSGLKKSGTGTCYTSPPLHRFATGTGCNPNDLTFSFIKLLDNKRLKITELQNRASKSRRKF